MRIGVAYNDSILIEEAGFDLLPLERPQDITAPRAFLKAVVLFKILGPFSWVERSTPTCSACSTKYMVSSLIDIGL